MSSHCLGEFAQARQRASEQTAWMTEPAEPVLWSRFIYQIGLIIESKFCYHYPVPQESKFNLNPLDWLLPPLILEEYSKCYSSETWKPHYKAEWELWAVEVAGKQNPLLLLLKTPYTYTRRGLQRVFAVREDACLRHDKQESIIQVADRHHYLVQWEPPSKPSLVNWCIYGGISVLKN